MDGKRTLTKDLEDAFGHLMYDYLHAKGETGEIVERDDGFVNVSGGAKVYFSTYDDWPDYEKTAMSYVKGRVLDIGCGAGRHSLFLQDKGHEIVAIDSSLLAIEVCKQRGLKNAKTLSITDISSKLGIFDTILMLGNNFSLFGSPEKAQKLLRKFLGIASEQGQIITQTRDPYQTTMPEHLEYHEMNRKQGKMAGQAKIRIRYKKCATPWFNFFMVSKKEMQELLKETGWKIQKFFDGQNGIYVAIIGKT